MLVFSETLTPHSLLDRVLLFAKEQRLVDACRQRHFDTSLCLHIPTGARRYGKYFAISK